MVSVLQREPMARIVLIVFVVAVVTVCMADLTSTETNKNDGESMQAAETFSYIKRKLFGGGKAPSKKSSSSSSLWEGYPLANGYFGDGYGYGWY